MYIIRPVMFIQYLLNSTTKCNMYKSFAQVVAYKEKPINS